MKKIIFLLFLIILISNTAAAFEVVIDQEEIVESSEIYLGEIAKIDGFGLGKDDLNKLKNLQITNSPQPGYQKFINRVLVELSIKNLGYQNSDFRLEMPKKVVIKRKSSFVDKSAVKTFVEAELTKQLQADSENLFIKELNNPEQYNIAAGNYQFQIASQSRFKYGRNNIALEIIQNKEVQKRIYYRFNLGIKRKIYQAVKDIPYNSELKKVDFKVVEKIIYNNPDQIISEWNAIQNKELKTSLRKGDYLSYKVIKNPYLVQWGDRVRVEIIKNNVQLVSYVIAKERGRMGDEITVENENSGYRFQAVVISENEVKYVSP
ncbi:MAG: flagellar basal body P-ring formation chaperone FlgA [Bacillota bacterium]